MLIKRLPKRQVYAVYVDNILNRAVICILYRPDCCCPVKCVPFSKNALHKDTSIIRCREVLKKNCKNLKLISEGESVEIYSFEGNNVKRQKVVTNLIFDYGEEYRRFYVTLEDGSTTTIREDILKQLLLNNVLEFVDLELNKNGEVIQKKIDYSKCRDWLDTDDCYQRIWGYLEKMNKFNQEQKDNIKNFIIKHDYGMDNEDLIDLFTNSRQWFPNKFGTLDTMCIDRAYELMYVFKITKENYCSKIVRKF